MNYLKNNTSTLKTSNHIFPLCAIRGGFKASAGRHCAYWVSKLPHMKLFSAAVPPSARTHVLGRAAGSCRLCARTGRFGLWLRAWHTCSCENSSKSKDEKPTTTTTSWPIGWVGGWWLNGGGKKYYKTDKNKNACMCAARALACSFVCLCARSCGYHTQREKRICILFFLFFFSSPPSPCPGRRRRRWWWWRLWVVGAFLSEKSVSLQKSRVRCGSLVANSWRGRLAGCCYCPRKFVSNARFPVSVGMNS